MCKPSSGSAGSSHKCLAILRGNGSASCDSATPRMAWRQQRRSPPRSGCLSSPSMSFLLRKARNRRSTCSCRSCIRKHPLPWHLPWAATPARRSVASRSSKDRAAGCRPARRSRMPCDPLRLRTCPRCIRGMRSGLCCLRTIPTDTGEGGGARRCRIRGRPGTLGTRESLSRRRNTQDRTESRTLHSPPAPADTAGRTPGPLPSRGPSCPHKGCTPPRSASSAFHPGKRRRPRYTRHPWTGNSSPDHSGGLRWATPRRSAHWEEARHARSTRA
mmetsp:Transcript_81438/g.264442  ORF Transcript_81438/g.264442 Transcript_81438/m.264442 type:complete len:273 (-) Transcript_81438:2528-3346(-)